jgi:hypothetical protein
MGLFYLSITQLSNSLLKNPFLTLCRHSCGSRACPALDAGNPSSFLNTGSLLSQGLRLDSRFRESDAELEFFRILLKGQGFFLED